MVTTRFDHEFGVLRYFRQEQGHRFGGFDRLEAMRFYLGTGFVKGGRQCERMSTTGNAGLLSVEVPNMLEREEPVGSPAWPSVSAPSYW